MQLITFNIEIIMTNSLLLKSLFTILIVAINGNNVYAQLPQLRSVDCNRTNTLLTQPLYANILNANQYKFKVTNLDLGVTDSITKPVRWFYLDEIPSVSRYNCNYEVSVCMDVGSGFGAYGNICTPSSIALISKLRNADCGKHIPVTLYPFSLGLYANTTIADSWDFQIRMAMDTALVDDVFGLPTRKFRLNMASDVFQQYNREYEIRVRTTQGGIVQPWGPWCSVYTPYPVQKPRFRSMVTMSSAGTTFEGPPPPYSLGPISNSVKWNFVFNIGEPITTTLDYGIQSNTLYFTQGFEQPRRWYVTTLSRPKPVDFPVNENEFVKISNEKSMNIYPNPFSDVIRFRHNLEGGILVIKIYNNSGSVVKEFELQNHSQLIDLSELTVGTYIIECKALNNDFINQYRIIKSY